MLFKYIKRFSKKIISSILLIYLFSSTFIISQAESYEWTILNNYGTIETNNQAENENIAKIAKDELNLNCESAILIEQNSGQILYEKIVMNNVPCSENAASMVWSQIWLDTKETLTVNEMLKAITIVSANDCTVQL